MSLVFDTLKLSKALGRAFTPEQAEVLTEALTINVNEGLVTKADLAITKAELKEEIAEVRGEIASVEIRLTAKIADIGTELKTGIATVRAEMANQRADLTRLMVVSLSLNAVSMVGLMIAVAKLVAQK